MSALSRPLPSQGGSKKDLVPDNAAAEIESQLQCIAQLLFALMGIASPGTESLRKQWKEQLGVDSYDAQIMLITENLRHFLTTWTEHNGFDNELDDILALVNSYVKADLGCTVIKLAKPDRCLSGQKLLASHPYDKICQAVEKLLVCVLHLFRSIRVHITSGRNEGDIPMANRIWSAASKNLQKAFVTAEMLAKDQPDFFQAAFFHANSMNPALAKYIQVEFIHSRRLEDEYQNRIPIFCDFDDKYLANFVRKVHAIAKSEAALNQSALRHTAELLSKSKTKAKSVPVAVEDKSKEGSKNTHRVYAKPGFAKLKAGTNIILDVKKEIPDTQPVQPVPETTHIAKKPKVVDDTVSQDGSTTSKVEVVAPEEKSVVTKDVSTSSDAQPGEATAVKQPSLTAHETAPVSSKSKLGIAQYRFNGYPISETVTPTAFDSLKREVLDKNWTRKQTSGAGLMCGLYASAITLSNMMAEIDLQNPYVDPDRCADDMIAFFRSDIFQEQWQGYTNDVLPPGIFDKDAANTRASLTALSNLGIDAVAVLVSYFVQNYIDNTGEWGIGVLTARSEKGKTVIVPCGIAPSNNARLIWIYNNQPAGASADTGMNHFEGLGPTEKKQSVGKAVVGRKFGFVSF